MRADQRVGHALVVGEVGHFHAAEQLHTVATESRHVDDSCIGKYTLLETNAAEQAPLFALGGMILKILAEVALVASLCDGIPYFGQLHALQLVEFGHELVVAFL